MFQTLQSRVLNLRELVLESLWIWCLTRCWKPDNSEVAWCYLSYDSPWCPSREGKASGQAVSLLTLKGDFTLAGNTAEDMAELVTMFLSGLTERSRYAVTLKESDRQGQRTCFSFSCCYSWVIYFRVMSANWFVPVQMTPHSWASRRESSS